MYSSSIVEDNMWAKQFVAHDRAVRESIDTGSAPTMSAMVGHITTAASKASTGGVIFFLSGHGVTAEGDATASWVSLGKGANVKIKGNIVFYSKKPDQYTKSPETFDNDAIATAKDLETAAGKAKFLQYNPLQKYQGALQEAKNMAKAAEERKQARLAYNQIGATLKTNEVARVVFLACSIGKDASFIQQISNDWGVEVVAYKQFITLQIVDGKALLFLSPSRAGDGAKRAIDDAIFIPDINTTNAFVVTPP